MTRNGAHLMIARIPSSLSRTFGALAVATTLAGTLAACTTAGQQVQGYMIDDATVAQVQPGMDAQKVLQILGTPSTVSTVGNQSWYYISQNTDRSFMFQTPKVIDQRVLTVVFTNKLKVDHIANYGLKDGQVFDFNSNTTPSAKSDMGFIKKLFRMD
jgi:outer membrane protein assembly factor BamE (lipoprotein component of BamABCDE complex)